MFLATLKNLFDIDDVGKRWGVRILFVLIVIMNCAVHFNPYADTNFDALYSWAEQVQAAETSDSVDLSLMIVPLTEGNRIFIATAILTAFITLMASFLYSGMYIKAYREKGEKLNVFGEPIKSSKLALRMLLLTIFSILVAFPFIIVFGSFLLIAVLAVPFLYVIPSAYLSGDYGLFDSFPNVVSRTKGFYLERCRGILLILCVYFLLDYPISFIATFSTTAYYIIDSAFGCWIMLSFARYAAKSYCSMMLGRHWRKMNLPGLIFNQDAVEAEDTDKLNEDTDKEE